MSHQYFLHLYDLSMIAYLFAVNLMLWESGCPGVRVVECLCFL